VTELNGGNFMSAPLQPLGDYVVAQAEEAQTKTASGIYLPQNAQEKPKTAKVVAVGPDAKQVKVGDKIVYKSYSTTDVKVGSEEYILVKEEDVLATVK
jgi:chaperonin GroES